MPGQATLTIKQGADWTPTLEFTDEDGELLDLTGYTAKLQARDEDGNAVIDLSTTNGKIAISTTTMTLTLTQTETAAIESGTYRYDLFIISSGGVDDCPLEGWVDVLERVTV